MIFIDTAYTVCQRTKFMFDMHSVFISIVRFVLFFRSIIEWHSWKLWRGYILSKIIVLCHDFHSEKWPDVVAHCIYVSIKCIIIYKVKLQIHIICSLSFAANEIPESWTYSLRLVKKVIKNSTCGWIKSLYRNFFLSVYNVWLF